MSADAIAWIASIAFLVILGIGFLIGFWRGLNKTVFSFILYFVAALVAFFITPVITKSIMGIKVTVAGETGNLSQIIVNILKRNSDINKLVTNNPKMALFLEGLPYAIVNTIVFIVFTISTIGVFYTIYKIIARIFFRNKSGKPVKRLTGGLLGIIKTFVLVVFVFMPFASLIGVCDELTTQENFYTSAQAMPETEAKYGVIGDRLPKNLVTVIKGVEGSMLTKVCGVFGLDDALFDYYANVEVENQKIYLRQEVSNYYKAIDFSYQILTNEDIVYKNLDYDKLSSIIDNIENGAMFKLVISPVMQEVIIDYQEYDILNSISLVSEFEDVINEIKGTLETLTEQEVYDYILNDVDNMFLAFRALGQNGVIDDVQNLSDKSAQNILTTITKSTNIQAVNNALKKIFSANVVQDTIVPLANKVIEKIGDENIDEIGVDTSSWTSENWDETSNKITGATEDLSVVLGEVNFSNISDVASLLEDESDANLTLALTKLGSFIDKILDIDLLKTTENESIFNGFLTNNNLSLPAGQVENRLGQMITISNYEDLFTFVAPSIEKVKAERLYTILTESETAKETILSLGQVVAKTGNENILSEILLPLYQIGFTKEKIFDQTLCTISNSVIDFSLLSSYSDWKSDLGYISSILSQMSKNKIGTKSYLSYVLDGDTKTILDDMNDAKIDAIIKPILYAKSTLQTKKDMIRSINDLLDEITNPALSAINIESVTLKEGHSEDQAQEICNVFKKFASISRTFSEGNTIEDIDKTALGLLLDTMQKNAYRVELSGKSEAGLFRGAFINLVNKIKNTNPAAVTVIENEKGAGYMNESNYKNVDFIEVMQIIAENS